MTTMSHHHGRSPEKTLYHLPPVVPAGSASSLLATGL